MGNPTIKMPSNLKAVLFDLDGTLIDTADEFIPAVQTLRAEHDLDELPAQRIRASVSNGARALVMLALDIEDTHPEYEEKRLRLLQLYREQLGTKATLYPGIQPLLDHLVAQGMSWGISTNKPSEYTLPLLQKMNIVPAPGSIVCPDDVKDRKPHPESLYRNCKELGCAPHEAIYIGDHRRDIEAGKRAGMFTIAAAYGYIEPNDAPHSWNANALAKRSQDLLPMIISKQ